MKLYPLLVADFWQMGDEDEGEPQYSIVGVFSTKEKRAEVAKKYEDEHHYRVNDWEAIELDSVQKPY